MQKIHLKPIEANQENTKEYGHFIGENISPERLPIPFYDHVDEGQNIPFEYTGLAVLRTARIHPTSASNKWLERHMNMTQFFIGLGQQEFALLLGKPTHHYTGKNSLEPDLATIQCFKFSPGTGLLLNKGTWHDFPMAINRPVTCITGNSDEVVKALVAMKYPDEMNAGDVFKIDLTKRLGIEIMVEFQNERK